jgi:hypothetical protein
VCYDCTQLNGSCRDSYALCSKESREAFRKGEKNLLGLKKSVGDMSIRMKRAILVISIAYCGLMTLMRMK